MHCAPNRTAVRQAVLLAKAETLNQRTIGVNVRRLEIVQQLAATAHHAQQATTGMVILDVLLEVAGQVIDARGQQGDLDFRGARIASRTLVFIHDLRFLRNSNRHVKLSFLSSDAAPV